MDYLDKHLVKVSHVVTPELFYVQMEDRKLEFIQFNCEVKKYCPANVGKYSFRTKSAKSIDESGSSSTSNSSRSQLINEGNNCFVKTDAFTTSIGNRMNYIWCRAVIDKVSHENECLVFLLDYGVTKWVPLDHVFISDGKDFENWFNENVWPFFAYKCGLYYIRPVPLYNDWDDGAIKKMKLLTKDRQLLMYVKNYDLFDEDYKWLVDLAEREESGYMSLIDHLVFLRFANIALDSSDVAFVELDEENWDDD